MLAETAQTAESWPWYLEIIKQGGLVAVIVVMAIVVRYILAKLTKSEDRLVTNRAESDAREIGNLARQKATHDVIVAEKNHEIEVCQRAGEAIEASFREDLRKFLVENIEARNETSDAIREMKRDLGDKLGLLLTKSYIKR